MNEAASVWAALLVLCVPEHPSAVDPEAYEGQASKRGDFHEAREARNTPNDDCASRS
jgi:hypothetical protein